MPLIETNPELVAAARTALQAVEQTENCTQETTFKYQNKKWWTKVRMDPHSNTVDRWDVFPVEDVHQRW